MKTAAEYAKAVETVLLASDWSGTEAERIALAQVYATQQSAAATLEAASPPWLEAETKLFYCRTEWTDEQSRIPGEAIGGDRPHRCVHAAGHEREEPHYCRCGAEL